MLKQLFSLQNRLPLLVLGALIVGNVLLGTVLYHQLLGMANANQATVGRSFAHQLAYSVKTPMLHRDPLSLQVAVSEIARQPGVARAAIVDKDNRLLAEEQVASVGENGLEQYRAAITIEDAVNGFALVELDRFFYRRQGVALFRMALVLSVLTSLAAVAVCWRLHHNYVERIRALITRLPSAEAPAANAGEGSSVQAAESSTLADDELEQLEQKIAPLLTVKHQDSQPVGVEQQHCTHVGLKCDTFVQLRGQLSGDHFTELLAELDALVQSLLKLYDGELISFSDNTLVLQFTGAAEDDDYPVRALYTTFALLKRLQKWRTSKGLELEIAAALCTGPMEKAHCGLMRKLMVEEYQKRLQQLHGRAASGDVLLDKATAGHVALDHIALLEPVSSDMDVLRCEGLEATADTLVVRQLALLDAVS